MSGRVGRQRARRRRVGSPSARRVFARDPVLSRGCHPRTTRMSEPYLFPQLVEAVGKDRRRVRWAPSVGDSYVLDNASNIGESAVLGTDGTDERLEQSTAILGPPCT